MMIKKSTIVKLKSNSFILDLKTLKIICADLV